MSQINTTLKAIKAQGGCTFAATGETLNPTKGWQVSTQDLYTIPLYKLTKKFLNSVLQTIKQGTCLGVWIDNNKVYIDQSEWIATKRQAIKIGKANKQLAIFGWARQECVNL